MRGVHAASTSTSVGLNVQFPTVAAARGLFTRVARATGRDCWSTPTRDAATGEETSLAEARCDWFPSREGAGDLPEATARGCSWSVAGVRDTTACCDDVRPLAVGLNCDVAFLRPRAYTTATTTMATTATVTSTALSTTSTDTVCPLAPLPPSAAP